MTDTLPLSDSPAVPSVSQMSRHHHLALAAIVGALSLVLLALGWNAYARQHAALWWTLSSQSEQLQLALNDTLDVARSHVSTMRLATERNLRQPTLADSGVVERLERRNQAPLRDAPWDRLPEDLVKDIGSVQVDPSPSKDGLNAYRRDIPAPLGALAQVTSSHSQHKRLQWSYFLDAQKQWRWVYPAQSREQLLSATSQTDMAGTLAVLWDAAGTSPLDAAGPARNPHKELVWTAVHTDPIQKNGVVSVLAPVYSADRYLGVVGTDLTLDALNTVLQERTLNLGNAWVVDSQGQVLAHSASAAAALPAGPYNRDTGWLHFALRGTDWNLLVQAPSAQLRKATWAALVPMLLTAVLGLLSVVGASLWLRKYYVQPALQLAEYVRTTDTPHIKRPPPAPPLWAPWFESATRFAMQRRDQTRAQYQRIQQLELELRDQATALRNTHMEHERAMGEKAAELRSAYAQLSATLAQHGQASTPTPGDSD